MFRDEAAGKQITNSCNLRPKLYGFKTEGEDDYIKCKGIKKNVIKKSITYQDLVDCLNNETKEMRQMNIIKSEKHQMKSVKVSKIALSGNDNKRKICDDKMHTFKYA